MNSELIHPDVVRALEPIASVAPERAADVARMCRPIQVRRGRDPFKGLELEGQAIYLVKGELLLYGPDGGCEVVVGGSEGARRPLSARVASLSKAKAITDVELFEIDEDELHALLAQDQLRNLKPVGLPAGYQIVRSETWNTWRLPSQQDSGGFLSVRRLLADAFPTLPSQTVDAVFAHCSRMRVQRGDRVVHQSQEGDYYYVLESGRATVTRQVGAVTIILRELGCGDTFGEEALLSGGRRNATVTMRTDGMVLRLPKDEFNELLRDALLHELGPEQAGERLSAGALLIDVRFPAEFLADRQPEAVNIPLSEIRDAVATLDEGRDYVLVCNDGRRSATAAFILAKHGLRAWWAPAGVDVPVAA